jgi:hypothetical protein
MTSTIQSQTTGFVRTSHPWTAADSAAGFVLRYLIPMREQLIPWVGSESLADECIKRLVAHLVTKGFGDQGKGRIRDFLMRGIRSAAKSAIADVPEAVRPKIDFAKWSVESPSWLANWRQGLLTRAWRSLERLEHKDMTKPFYTVLRMATEYPNDDAAMLAIRINTQTDVSVDKEKILELLSPARTIFAEMLELEIEETLEQADPSSVMREIETLSLAGIFAIPKPQ